MNEYFIYMFGILYYYHDYKYGLQLKMCTYICTLSLYIYLCTSSDVYPIYNNFNDNSIKYLAIF